MKKMFLIAVAAAGMMTAQAQQALEATNFGSNWSIGIDGGATTPLKGHAFFGSMRGAFGLHVEKQISPAFALGVEGLAGINTSSWENETRSKTAIDNTYVGAYGSVNLFNLFGGYKCDGRFFDIAAVAGAGWGHLYYPGNGDHNYFATRVGLDFNFNVNKNLTIALKPQINWNMSDVNVAQTTAAYNIHNATFNILAGVTYHFGSFKCVEPINRAEIDALNAKINELRGELDATNAATAAAENKANALAAELTACQNRKPEVIKEVSNNLQSVRYIFYRIGSSKITADQQPNVEMVASFLKNHKNSKVVIKGYASPDGNIELNKKLAAARAESVKTMLVNKYGISADRITAQGEGIGEMFKENSWNRVSICTLEE
ncbi:MAG: OmpA family protein [Paramuribaculum sp.]|nr:OmpA family protein [Paramuribaculum sp.]